MKIGILTFHRAHNYGAVLQCFALQEVLKGMGHEVEVIDYRQPWIEDFYKAFSMQVLRKRYKGIKRSCRYILNYSKRVKVVMAKRPLYESFRDRYLSLSRPCNKNLPQNYDAYIIGSDQLWGLHCIGDVPDPVYLGRFKHPSTSKVIGYAISTNKESIVRLSNTCLKEDIRNFDTLSLREQFAIDEVKRITAKDIDLCIDPTLLTTKETWEPLTTNSKWKNKKYVLIYQVRGSGEAKKYIFNTATDIAKQISDDCEVVNINTDLPTVEEFVSMFKYASYVVTSSFHATVFSLIFNTPFFSVKLNDGKDGRYVNLLKSIGAEDKIIQVGDTVCLSKKSFDNINEEILKLRRHSLDYLTKSLN